jgi:hypothetical protein
MLTALADTDETERTMAFDDLKDLSPVLDVPTAARLVGIGRTTAYRSVHDGTWPTAVLRIRGRFAIPTAPLLALLGIDTGAKDEAALAGDGDYATNNPQVAKDS